MIMESCHSENGQADDGPEDLYVLVANSPVVILKLSYHCFAY